MYTNGPNVTLDFYLAGRITPLSNQPSVKYYTFKRTFPGYQLGALSDATSNSYGQCAGLTQAVMHMVARAFEANALISDELHLQLILITVRPLGMCLLRMPR